MQSGASVLYRVQEFERADSQRDGIGQTQAKRVVAYEFDKQTEALLIEVVDFYSRLSVGELVNLSHARGGPWDEVWNYQGQVNPGMKIDNALIARFYAKVNAPFTVQ
jgi:uncharacterized phage-associated protein